MPKNEVVVVLTSLPSQIAPATTVSQGLLNRACDDNVARLIALVTTMSRGSALKDNIARLKDSSRNEKSVQYCMVWYATHEMDRVPF